MHERGLQRPAQARELKRALVGARALSGLNFKEKISQSKMHKNLLTVYRGCFNYKQSSGKNQQEDLEDDYSRICQRKRRRDGEKER